MRIPESKISEIQAAADIVQIIGEYVRLKKAGKDYRGVCPFHGDKDPSFYVSPHKGIFHCFGCAVGGSVFNFLMRIEGLSFVEAVRSVAGRYGIEVQAESSTASFSKSEKERLLAILTTAQRYFQDNLRSNADVTDYLKGRGIPLDWFDIIGFGFAKDSWDSMQDHLRRSGIDPRDAEKAGLLKPRATGGHYDYFRSRVTIPIHDLSARLVAFGGRAYGDGDPKYLNSPEGVLFKKRDILFGMDSAREAVRQRGYVILVEGYFDQISLRVRGVENVVAPLGTSLGSEQVRLVKRFTDRVVTVFDGDEAGLRAVRRALPLFMAESIEPLCLILREDKDPDEAINRVGPDAFRSMVESAGSMIDYFLDWLSGQYDLATMQGRNLAMEESVPVIRQIADSKERDYLIERFSSRLRIREERLRRVMVGRGNGTSEPRISGPASRKQGTGFPAHERNIVRGMLADCAVVDRIVESGVIKDLHDQALRSLAERIVDFRNETGSLDAVAFAGSLDDEQTASLVAAWLNPRHEQDDLGADADVAGIVEDSIACIRRRKLEKRKAEIQERMKPGPDAVPDYDRLAMELANLTQRLYK